MQLFAANGLSARIALLVIVSQNFKPWYNNSFLIYASSEKNRMLACRFGEHRDNSRNSQSVFLVVYGKIKDEIILKKINRGCCGCNSPFFTLQEIAFL